MKGRNDLTVILSVRFTSIDNSSRDWANIDRPGDDVVDADFEVVDDDKRKS
jgi:hypothetical protein